MYTIACIPHPIRIFHSEIFENPLDPDSYIGESRTTNTSAGTRLIEAAPRLRHREDAFDAGGELVFKDHFGLQGEDHAGAQPSFLPWAMKGGSISSSPTPCPMKLTL